jgi:hypothetical protein
VFLFSHLRGRRVLVTLSNGEAVEGVVLRAGVFATRLASPAMMLSAGADPMDGTARIPHRSVVWIQEF